MASEGATAAAEGMTGQWAVWKRIGAGVSLIAVLLAALALLDDRGAPPPSEPPKSGAATPAGPAAMPAPTVVTEAREPLIGAAVAVPEKEAAVPALLATTAEPAAPAPAVASEAVPEGSAAPEIAPPAARQADAPPPSESNAEAVAQGAGAAASKTAKAAAEPDDTPPAKRARPTPEAAQLAATKGGYLLQLGVFGVSGNAEAMYAELQRQGVPARLETRVVAGPFPNRKSAEEARERLARAGLVKGIVVPPR